LTVVEADLMSEERARELKWFTDVLQAYFDAVDMDDFVLPLQRSFMAAATQSAAPEKFFPYPRSGLQKSNVTFEQFKALAIQRRSTRWFEAEPVPRELIDKAVLIGLQAPSACNRQPFEFRIFDHQERCREIANIPMGTSGYAQNIPAIVVVVGKLNAYFDERDRHLIYVDGALASMSFMFALETLGLASCPINWPDMEERERMMEAALGLKKWERPIMLMAVGFPDPEGGIPFSEKAPIDFMRRYN
jgi:nitroreductase